MLAQQKSRGNKFLARKLQVENLSLRREAVSQRRREEGKNDRMSFRKQHRTCKKIFKESTPSGASLSLVSHLLARMVLLVKTGKRHGTKR